jgi:hypothetical protein
MGLTARSTGAIILPNGCTQRVEDWTHNYLSDLGITFESGLQTDSITLKEIPEYGFRHPIYHKGILLTNGEMGPHNKGSVLVSFLNYINRSFKVIVLIDDKKRNLDFVENHIKDQRPDLSFLGIQYFKALNQPAAFVSHDEFKMKWDALISSTKKQT